MESHLCLVLGHPGKAVSSSFLCIFVCVGGGRREDRGVDESGKKLRRRKKVVVGDWLDKG